MNNQLDTPLTNCEIEYYYQLLCIHPQLLNDPNAIPQNTKRIYSKRIYNSGETKAQRNQRYKSNQLNNHAAKEEWRKRIQHMKREYQKNYRKRHPEQCLKEVIIKREKRKNRTPEQLAADRMAQKRYNLKRREKQRLEEIAKEPVILTDTEDEDYIQQQKQPQKVHMLQLEDPTIFQLLAGADLD